MAQIALGNMKDEELVAIAQDPSSVDGTIAMDLLVERYRGLVLLKSRSYFVPGSERDDIIQEGMIGLLKAIRDFRPNKKCSFRSFANLCITRQMIAAVKAESRTIRSLTRGTPFSWLHSSGDRDDQDYDPSEAIRDHRKGPEQEVIHRETAIRLRRALRNSLSKYEQHVLDRFCDGCTYREIAQRLEIDKEEEKKKSVDNALVRIRRKARRFGLDTD